jgi:hypothetical protein
MMPLIVSALVSGGLFAAAVSGSQARDIAVGAVPPPGCVEQSAFFNIANREFFACTAGVWQHIDPLEKAIFDVTQFGATGDGRTDDRRAIQAASDSASRARDAIVFFPPGKYVHNGVIDFRANTAVVGSGQVTVLISSTPDASAIRFADAGDCEIHQLKISSDAPARLQNDEAAAVLFRNSHDCVASNLWIEGAAAAGIIVHASNGIVLDHIEVKGTRADGIHVVSGSHRIVVSNNMAYDTGDDSFSAVAYESQEQTDGVVFDNNVSMRSRARGVACIGANNCVITHNKIYGPAAHGIAIAWEKSYETRRPHNARVEDNLIRDVVAPGMNALLLNEATDVQVGINEVYDSTPVYFHSSSNISVKGMRLYGSIGAGLIARDCRNLSILDTRVQGAGGSGFLLDGITGGEIAGNTLIDVQMNADTLSGSIDVVNSRHLVGERNTLQRSKSWKGASYGPLRVLSSLKITISVDVARDAVSSERIR